MKKKKAKPKLKAWYVMGVDPGFRNTGIGWVKVERDNEREGLRISVAGTYLISLPKESFRKEEKVLFHLRGLLSLVLDIYPISLIGYEAKSSQRELPRVAEARGVLKERLYSFSREELVLVLPMTKREIEKTIGLGKEEIREKIREASKMVITEHEQDALAVAWGTAKKVFNLFCHPDKNDNKDLKLKNEGEELFRLFLHNLHTAY